jgi:FkbM family methyltransferase
MMDKNWNEAIKNEVYDGDVYSLKQAKFSRAPKHIIDIGTNYGWFSYLAAELHPQCHVWAYELMEENYVVAKENLKKFNNAQVSNKGVTGDNVILQTLYTSHNRGGHKGLYAGNNCYISKSRFVSTKTHNRIIDEIPPQISFKEIIETNKIDYVDFLKIDCEGCEYEIFNQIFKYDLDKRIKNLVFEIHGKGNPEYNKLLKELEKRFSTFKKGKITKASNI